MKQKYRVTGPRPVLDTEPGDEFEHEFTPDAELDLLSARRIEIIPRAYQVVGTSRVAGTDPGGLFTAAFTAGREAALIEGGHIERHEPRAAAPRAVKPTPAPANNVKDKE